MTALYGNDSSHKRNGPSSRHRMSKLHAEIAGAGFAGLVAAIALAERGWSVRVHEKSPQLRAEGFAIPTQPNVLKVLETIGVRDHVLQGGMKIIRRETRDWQDRPTMIVNGGGGHRISRQYFVTALEDRARKLGVDFEYGSEIASAEANGGLTTSDGRRFVADIVIAADGIGSRIRESLGIPAIIKNHTYGAMRLLVSRLPKEAEEEDRAGAMTCERWSGTRRILTSPCSSQELYVALSCLARDKAGRAAPLDETAWSRSFPHLAVLFRRICVETDWSTVRWVQFQTVKLKRWSQGRVAILGDAAHAMPPNLAQGAGCAIMNALGLAVSLANNSLDNALRVWEARERPLTEHTQRWSGIYGSLTVCPERVRSTAFMAMERVKWIRDRYLRTANHIPTGYKPQT
jgi:2-polyprenyl-6-methoxyphenol hydroxylase-like FAD-dependent oxidoreductase